jgi:hypothetical protein
MMVAYQMLRDGRPKEARNALIPIAFDPHGGAMGKAAAAILAKLDAGDVKGALQGAVAPPEDAAPGGQEER